MCVTELENIFARKRERKKNKQVYNWENKMNVYKKNSTPLSMQYFKRNQNSLFFTVTKGHFFTYIQSVSFRILACHMLVLRALRKYITGLVFNIGTIWESTDHWKVADLCF